MIDLTSKLGENNSIEHNKCDIYPQNQVILDCIMPSIPLKHFFFFYFFYFSLFGKKGHGIGKKVAVLNGNGADGWAENSLEELSQPL